MDHEKIKQQFREFADKHERVIKEGRGYFDEFSFKDSGIPSTTTHDMPIFTKNLSASGSPILEDGSFNRDALLSIYAIIPTMGVIIKERIKKYLSESNKTIEDVNGVAFEQKTFNRVWTSQKDIEREDVLIEETSNGMVLGIVDHINRLVVEVNIRNDESAGLSIINVRCFGTLMLNK